MSISRDTTSRHRDFPVPPPSVKSLTQGHVNALFACYADEAKG